MTQRFHVPATMLSMTVAAMLLASVARADEPADQPPRIDAQRPPHNRPGPPGPRLQSRREGHPPRDSGPPRPQRSRPQPPRDSDRMFPQADGPQQMRARLQSLEQKLDQVLHEIQSLRREMHAHHNQRESRGPVAMTRQPGPGVGPRLPGPPRQQPPMQLRRDWDRDPNPQPPRFRKPRVKNNDDQPSRRRPNRDRPRHDDDDSDDDDD